MNPGGLHYSEIIRRRLDERLSSNARYSLRAFARDLGVSPSRLCEILQGKQGLSESSARKIALRLGLSASEADRFCAMVAASDSRSKRKRAEARAFLAAGEQPREPSQLKEDAFRLISDWHHYAILELSLVSGFKGEPRWVSRQLGISEGLAGGALKRLLRMGLLKRAGSRVLSTGVELVTTDGVPSESIRKFNRQIIEKALDAIVLQTVEERDLGTLTVAINTRCLPELKALLKRQRTELNQLVNAQNKLYKADAVYCLATQFFRLTQKGN